MKLSLVTALCLSLLGSLAQAQSGPPDTSKIVKIALVKGWRMEGGSHMAALRISLAPGWKTYWRTGGDTGIAPKLDWQGTGNLDHIIYHWPRPEITTTDGLQFIGYHNELLLPIELFPKKSGAAISARVKVNIGVCREVCIPVSTTLTTTLSPNSDTGRFLIELALTETTVMAEKVGVRPLGCALKPIEDGYQIEASFGMPTSAVSPQIVIFETPQPDIWVAPSESRREGDTLNAKTSLMSYGADIPAIAPKDIRITIITATQAIDAGTCSGALQN